MTLTDNDKPKAPSIKQSARAGGSIVQVGGDANSISVQGETVKTDANSGADNPTILGTSPLVFLSYDGREKALADLIKRWITYITGPGCDVFLAEDPASVGVGDQWMSKIKRRLKDCDLFILLASKTSLERPWINIEWGSAWILEKPVVCLCHSGITRATLSQPYQSYQAYDLEDAMQLQAFVQGLTSKTGGSAAFPLTGEEMRALVKNAITPS